MEGKLYRNIPYSKTEVIPAGTKVRVVSTRGDWEVVCEVGKGKFITIDRRYLNITDYTDWEQRRYELAKAAMQGYCANPDYNDTYEKHAKLSVEIADALIKELKGEE